MSISIGEFSHSTGLNVKTLRYYHDIGLLEAARVDEFSGYRYYQAEQLKQAGLLRLLRATGMGIAEMRQVLSHPDEIDAQLAVRRDQLQVQRRLEDWALERAATWNTDLQRVNPVRERRARLTHWAGVSAVVDAAELENEMASTEEVFSRLEGDLVTLLTSLSEVFATDASAEIHSDETAVSQTDEPVENTGFIANSWTSLQVDKTKPTRIVIGLCFAIPGPLPADFRADAEISAEVVSGVLPERTEVWIRTASFADTSSQVDDSDSADGDANGACDDDVIEELLPGGPLPTAEAIALSLYLEEHGITEPREIRQKVVQEVSAENPHGATQLEMSITLD
ncbi:MerR family transcriptional regulator [Trueperella bialowiezensis]|uniref:Multidrug-efflux transporter 1 regulator n=1 Tax=Trueperella bialowiezensis TaxID=312285 RepID=A0A448PF07_9ACTO|nr:MerR family transcriptional regulator [Trueperella bialowiezensis]VEI13523.1 Multidrug-efflux transporter 1 regulator [Trueperella bialowiezensis]